MKHFGSKIPSLFFAAFLVLMFAQTTNATSAIMLSDTDLIVNSRMIVSGKVVSVTSDWDPAGTMVWTYVEINVERRLKGSLRESTLVLKQLGGLVNGFGVRIAGQPEFTRGEHVLLYLNSGVDGSLHSAHNFMGKFAIMRDSTGTEYVQRFVNPNEVELFGQSSTGEVTNRAASEIYFRMIRQTLKREAPRVAEAEAALRTQPLVAVPPEFSRKPNKSGTVSPEFTFVAGPLRWMEADSGQPIRYFVNPNSCPVAGGGAAEIARAMAAWPTQSGASIQLQNAGQTGSCGIVFDNKNTISFGDCMNQMDPPIGCAGVVGLTTVAWVPDSKDIGGTVFNRLLEADTIFNRGMDCFLGISANLAEVACHELGHSIGLGHSTDPSSLMWATAHGHGRDATLGADDKAGALAIYPSSGGPGPGPGGGSPVSITTLNVGDGIQGQRYTTVLQASGGTPPYRWSLVGGNLPFGLTLFGDGTIDGIPNFAGSSTFVAQVIDSASAPRTDSRLYTLNIRSNGGGAPNPPTISSIKVKGVKKLWVFGQNFRFDSLLLINGVVFQPVIFAQEGSQSQLLGKGKLNLGSPGTNVVVVVNIGDNRSAPFVF
jgi:hypothetical protein